MSILGLVAFIAATFTIGATVALIACTRQQQEDIEELRRQLKALQDFVTHDSRLLELVAQAVADQQRTLNETAGNY